MLHVDFGNLYELMNCTTFVFLSSFSAHIFREQLNERSMNSFIVLEKCLKRGILSVSKVPHFCESSTETELHSHEISFKNAPWDSSQFVTYAL